MVSISLDITGTPELLKRFEKLDKTIKSNIKDEINASALKIQADAKKLAPVNLGNLRNSIYLIEEDKGTDKFVFGVGASAKYAPYVEFGTGGKVTIPAGYEDYASQFKGKTGGKFKDMVLALTEWVQKKGIAGTYSTKTRKRTGGKSAKASQDKSAAYAIAISILRKGLRPQPFLIPAFEVERKKLTERIENIIKNA